MTLQSCDVAVIGGGIIGTAAAAYFAEAGVRVRLFERERIAAGASGRNSGTIQHPFEPHMARLHRATLPLYRELVRSVTDFQLAPEPAGLLLLSPDERAVSEAGRTIAAGEPDLVPEVLAPRELRLMEPSLAGDLYACRVATGYPVAPAAATNAFAARARAAGASLEIGEAAEPIVSGARVVGVRLPGGATVACEKILVAAGPWSPQLIPAWSERPPIRPLWGVVVSVALADAPHAVLEELGIDRPGPHPEDLFSLVSTESDTSVGSTFLSAQPDPARRVQGILDRAKRFVPALGAAQLVGVRACARPASLDGRPFIGQIAGIGGLFVCAGHGAWGISTGPASARMVVDEMLGRESSDPAFSPARAVD
ncbi:MAG TPA: FAD-binding oxidoreductase [Candidatus Limnocylindrales bacterium]